MNQRHSTVAAVVIAASLTPLAFAGGAANPAAQQPDKTQVVPDRQDVQSQGAPSVRELDSNAQRQHDRDSGSAGAQTATGSTAGTAGGSGTGENVAPGTRDWSKVDTNDDNLIQPEEMESWLKQVGPQAKDAKS